MSDRRYRAGESIEDICRACKLDRMHTVIVADPDGRPIRVACGYCDSEHNYRGGPASARPAVATRVATATAVPTKPRSGEVGRRPSSDKEPFPLVSDRER